jgi:glutamine amidotransferase
MKKIITIVDYGSGNLLSAQQSFIKAANSIGVDAEIQISNNPKNLELSTHVVLPAKGHLKLAWTE